MGADVLLTLLFGLLDRADKIGKLISTAKSENRDITLAELDTLSVETQTALDKLQADIKSARTASPGS